MCFVLVTNSVVLIGNVDYWVGDGDRINTVVTCGEAGVHVYMAFDMEFMGIEWSLGYILFSFGDLEVRGGFEEGVIEGVDFSLIWVHCDLI